jgi:hypothetical protein
MPTLAKKPVITDAMINQFMTDGLMEVVDGLTSPRLFFRGREIKAELHEQGGRFRIFGSDRYRYEIRWRGKRRKIMRSKLVWIWYFGGIPDSCAVHHHDAGRYEDGLYNIEAWDDEKHSEFHYGRCSGF